MPSFSSCPSASCPRKCCESQKMQINLPLYICVFDIVTLKMESVRRRWMKILMVSKQHVRLLQSPCNNFDAVAWHAELPYDTISSSMGKVYLLHPIGLLVLGALHLTLVSSCVLHFKISVSINSFQFSHKKWKTPSKKREKMTPVAVTWLREGPWPLAAIWKRTGSRQGQQYYE